ncbi:MAG: hypothetical protein ACOVNL_02400 [Prochlorococcaceae cyanobacterium]
MAPRHLPLVLLLSGLAALLLQAPPARAGSETAESVWNEQNALERAQQQVPAGATITGHRCESFGVGFDNTRYRCTVNYSQEAAEPSPGSQP